MTFHIWTFLFQVCNFVVLAFILHRLLYRPLREAIEERQQAQAAAEAEVAKARAEAEELQQTLHARLAKMEEERQLLLQQAREQAEAQEREVVRRTQEELEQQRQKAEESLRQLRKETLQALQGELAGMAVSLAQRLLSEAANTTLQTELARRLIETLRQMSEEERHALRTDWQHGDGAWVESIGEIDPATLRELTDCLQTLVGKPVPIRVQIRPELAGGLRLRLGYHSWDASLAGSLDEARRCEEIV